MKLVNYVSPVGNFYMVVDGDTVVESGFGEYKSKIPTVDDHEYLYYLDRYFSKDKSALSHINTKPQETTEFAQKVYEAMTQIPYGETASYKDIAEKIGDPKAVRAVGTVCGNNKLLLFIPCHRVIKSDGSLGEYAAGPEIKKCLLDLEDS